MHGTVMDVKTGKPLQNATVDVWQASTNGQIGLPCSKIRRVFN
jgi:protocatechuate 3,4-dioxygenase beta subunit